MRKLLAFDLDDTLAISKSTITDEMANLLARILEKYQICIITGGKYEQIHKQVIDRLNISARLLTKIHIMPTCGTRYYRFDAAANQWQIQYREDLTEKEKQKICRVIETKARQLGLWLEEPYGEIIEDRLSQITYSALGQQAPPEKKYQWVAINHQKRLQLSNLIAQELPELEVRVGGTTSIDITRIGIDKSYGINKLLELCKLSKQEILFFGDKLDKGGNDYPVKALGIDSIAVEGFENTIYALKGILGVTD